MLLLFGPKYQFNNVVKQLFRLLVKQDICKTIIDINSGGSSGIPPLGVQILSFLHTNFRKGAVSDLGAPSPLRGWPTLREILDPPLIKIYLVFN